HRVLVSLGEERDEAAHDVGTGVVPLDGAELGRADSEDARHTSSPLRRHADGVKWRTAFAAPRAEMPANRTGSASDEILVSATQPAHPRAPIRRTLDAPGGTSVISPAM